jgi:hypothetical protein
MKNQKYFLSLFIFFLIYFPYSATANTLDNWIPVTSPSNHWFYGMTYGNGNFVTVGDHGTILTSTDGMSWIARDNGDTHILYGVGSGTNAFVAVGTVGTILTSPDGATWTRRTSGTGSYLYSVAYGSNVFVAIGAAGTVRTSSNNGVTWTDPFWATPVPPDNWLYGIVYGWEFAAVGSYDGNPIYSELLTSPDGTNWFRQPSGTTEHLLGVAYGAGRFVAVGEKGVVLTSTDGTTWITTRAPADYNEDLYGVAYGMIIGTGYFVAVGQYGTILTSPDTDLVNWTYRNSGTAYDLQAVAFDTTNSAFAVAGGYGTILLDGDSIPTNPVKITEPYEVFFTTIQDAYNNLTTGDLESMALNFNEDLNFNINKSFALKGGYNSTFTDNPSSTTINGTVTITAGTVTVENIVIQ